MAPRIVLHFHPGWSFGDDTVLDAIVKSGRYLSQWQTRTSNGGLTAYRGGDRWRWESELFGGRYDDSPAEDRPLYGAWNRRDDIYGASPRFGSAYLRLRPEVNQRATFCWPDSVYRPRVVGGPEKLDELCELADSRDVDPTEFAAAAADLPLDDPLNDYVEAHVHGGLSIEQDVEAVVVDPTDRAVHAATLARLGCAVEEHPGYRVRADAIEPNYRGSVPVDLARALGGEIDRVPVGGVGAVRFGCQVRGAAGSDDTCRSSSSRAATEASAM